MYCCIWDEVGAPVKPAIPLNVVPTSPTVWPAAVPCAFAWSINGWKDPTPEPANVAACFCNASCPATVGANLEVSTGIAVAAVNCFA